MAHAQRLRRGYPRKGREMTDRELMQQALEALDSDNPDIQLRTALALRDRLERPEQDSVSILPDGSAAAVMSWPLPKHHWLYAKRKYRDGEYEPIELGKPILTHESREAVVSAVRYAIRGATNCGRSMDFDPDALVKNSVYALCGPYGQTIEQAEPVAWFSVLPDGMLSIKIVGKPTEGNWEPLYTTPPQRKPLNKMTVIDLADQHLYEGGKIYGILEFARAIEYKHGIKL